MSANHWGPMEWTASEITSKLNQRLDPPNDLIAEDPFRYAESAPIFDDFQDPANYTNEHENSRVRMFGEWDLNAHIDNTSGCEAGDHPRVIELDFCVKGMDNRPITWVPFDNPDDLAKQLSDDFLNNAFDDLNQECETQNLPAACFHYTGPLFDSRKETRDHMLIHGHFTGIDWMNRFSKRFWVFYAGDTQPASRPYPPLTIPPGIGPIIPILINVQVPDNDGGIIAPAVPLNLGPDAVSHLALTGPGGPLANLLPSATDPPGTIHYIWFSFVPNPNVRLMFPLHGDVNWGYRAYQKMHHRLYERLGWGASADIVVPPKSDVIRLNVYFGRFPAHLRPRDVFNPGKEHLPTLGPPLTLTAFRVNRHWWLMIIDSYLARIYRHDSAGRTYSSVRNNTDNFVRNLNKFFRKLPDNEARELVRRRAVRPHTDDAEVLAWETFQQKTNPGFRAYHLQHFPGIIDVRTTNQTGTFACGYYVKHWASRFVQALGEGRYGHEKASLTLPGFDPVADNKIVDDSLVAPRERPPVEVPTESLDSIGQQLARHPHHVQEAMWHLENAGAVLITYTNTDRRVRNNPKAGEVAYQLPACVPIQGIDGKETCGCGFIVLPVPINHKVILHSTRVLGPGGLWVESNASERTPPLPRILVGRNDRGTLLGCKGAFVMSNDGCTNLDPEPAILDPNKDLRACGYILVNPNGTNVMGPIPTGAPYPLSVNESLWAWVSKGNVPRIGPSSRFPRFKTSQRQRVRRRRGTLGDVVVPREANRVDEPLDHHQIPVISRNIHSEQAAIDTAKDEAHALARNAAREATEAPYAYHTPYDVNYDSFDELLPIKYGILPRKVRRTRNIERYKRNLYEYSESENDTDGNFDPTGQSRARKRIRQSTLSENALDYLSIDPKKAGRSLPVAPCQEALDWYKNTRSTKIRIGHLPAEQQLPRGFLQIKILVEHTTGVPGAQPLFRTTILPNNILLGGFQGLVKYLKASPHDLTRPDENPNVAPRMGETDELDYITPNRMGPLESDLTFQDFCQSLDIAWALDNDAVAAIQVSKWPMFCMGHIDFVLVHGGASIPIPPNVLDSLGGVECGIHAYVSHHIGTQFEFTLSYAPVVGGVPAAPVTYWGLHEPLVNRTEVPAQDARSTVHITITIRALNTITLHDIVTDDPNGPIRETQFAVLDVYLNTHYTTLAKFIQLCVTKNRLLEYANPQLFHDAGGGTVANPNWVPLATEAAWTTFIGGVGDGDAITMAFRRPIIAIVPQSPRYMPELRAIEFYFVTKSANLAGPPAPPILEQMVPPAINIMATDIMNIPQAKLVAFFTGYANFAAPLGHVICDRTMAMPPEKAYAYTALNWGLVLTELVASLKRGDFKYTRVVISGWTGAGGAAEAALIAAENIRIAARDLRVAAYQAAHPEYPPRDAKWVRELQRLMGEMNKQKTGG